MEGRVIPAGRFCAGMLGLAMFPMFMLGRLGIAGRDICGGAGRDMPPEGRAPPPPLGMAGRDAPPMGRAMPPPPPPPARPRWASTGDVNVVVRQAAIIRLKENRLDISMIP